MQQGTWRWVLTLIGLIAGGMGLSFAGSRLLHIPGAWPAAIPIALYALLIVAYGWRTGSLRFHAVRGAVLGACGIAALIVLDWMVRDVTDEYVWYLTLFMTSLPTVQQLRSQSDIERAAKAHRTEPWHYVIMAIGIALLVFFVVQALRR